MSLDLHVLSDPASHAECFTSYTLQAGLPLPGKHTRAEIRFETGT